MVVWAIFALMRGGQKEPLCRLSPKLRRLKRRGKAIESLGASSRNYFNRFR